MQRETVSLMRRDLLNALHSEPDLPSKLTRRLWDIAEMSGKLLRRKLNLEQINELKDLLTQSLDMLGLSENPLETVKLSSSDSQNEQHIQNTKKITLNLKRRLRRTVPLPRHQRSIQSCQHAMKFRQ